MKDSIRRQVPATKRQLDYRLFPEVFILVALLCVGFLKEDMCQGSVIIQFQLVPCAQALNLIAVMALHSDFNSPLLSPFDLVAAFSPEVEY